MKPVSLLPGESLTLRRQDGTEQRVLIGASLPPFPELLHDSAARRQFLQMDFAARVTYLRERCGLKQYGLAKSAGIERATISTIERGKTKPHSMAAGTLYRLARTLGVSMDLLFFEDETHKSIAKPQEP